ncbi:hypothetical protein [Actinoplanes sp. ATCC 53533]|uniref:hypothetical protein n=1 Tax=Actinoplanes sp. ATCC 53533 TaxID=1288362 RepID=UPI000F7670C7|nr:hypothetical protein [Actinoplanes sp. ATCC 53533]
MSKATRMLAMAGMALVAGATFSAAPATASTSTAQGTTAAKQSTQQQADAARGRDWVVGYYRTRRECERVGSIGERFNRWDDHECERVRRGFRTLWRLEVEQDWHGGGHDWNDGHGNGGPGHGNGNGGPGHGNGNGGPGHGNGNGGPGHGNGNGGPGNGGPGNGGPGNGGPGNGGPRR